MSQSDRRHVDPHEDGENPTEVEDGAAGMQQHPAMPADAGQEALEAFSRRRQRSGRIAMVSALASVLAVAVFALGWWFGRPSWPDDLSPDAGFARDMQIHHQQAVDMSLIVRSRGVSSDVMTLAYDIATTQENQRGQMRGWLETWELPQARSDEAMAWMTRTGHQHDSNAQNADMKLLPDGRMPGMASRAQMDRLQSLQGKPAEVAYLQMMTTHHRAGVTMAKACVSSCTDPEAVSLAQAMVAGQQSELSLMATMLRARGASVPGA